MDKGNEKYKIDYCQSVLKNDSIGSYLFSLDFIVENNWLLLLYACIG